MRLLHTFWTGFKFWGFLGFRRGLNLELNGPGLWLALSFVEGSGCGVRGCSSGFRGCIAGKVGFILGV